MSEGSKSQVPVFPLSATVETDAPPTLKMSPEVSIKPPLPLAPIAFADKLPATLAISPQTKMLPPSPLLNAFAVRVLLESIWVFAEVGTVTSAGRLGKSAAIATVPRSGFALKSRPIMMLPPPVVPFASSVAPASVVLMRPDCTIVPPKPAPPFVWM